MPKNDDKSLNAAPTDAPEIPTLDRKPIDMLRPAEQAETGVTDGLVRVSVGLEDADDLVADLAHALDA